MDDTFTLRQLLAAAAIAPRTLRSWIQQGIVPAPEFRGPATVYPREALLAATAMRHLRAQGVRHADAAAQVAGASRDRLEAILGIAATPQSAPVASVAPPVAAITASDEGGPALAAPTTGPRETWHRLALLPGLELHVRDDARAFVQRIADEIVARYGAQ